MSTVDLKIQEYEQDIAELQTLLSASTRGNVKQFVASALEKWQADVTKLHRAEKERLTRLENAAKQQQRFATSGGHYTKKIDSYGWDQSEKFVKVYVTSLKGLNEDDVVCNYTAKSFDLIVNNLNNVNYNLNVNNLLNDIDPAQSYVKCKPDMITVFLRKVNIRTTWSYLTGTEKSIKDKPMPKMDTNQNADPQEGLMSMMKKMYDEGDDDMKRTISKAFAESRDKKSGMAGGDMDMGGLGDMGL